MRCQVPHSASLKASGVLSLLLVLTGCGGGGGGGPAGAGSSAGVGASGAASTKNAGSLAWSTPSATWADMGAAAVATVSRSGGSDGTVTATYATQDGTAVAGRDYTATSGTLTWGNQDSSPKTVAVLLGSKAKVASPLAFTLVLNTPGGGATVPPGTSAMKITLDHWKVPASLPQFNLSKWRLDLPVDPNGGTGGPGGQTPADAILPAELGTTYVGPFFFGDAQGRIVFTAPANGAVTTPGVGSNHTRSELHEVYTGPGADANGNWTGNGVLTATCSVQAVASASDAAVIGQLRGQNNDLALLLYRPRQHDVAVDVYQSNTSGSTHARTPLAINLGLGDAISYSMGYRGGVLTVTVNGATQSFTTGPTWSGVPVYFKLGAYHLAPNSGNAPNDLTMVTFSAFSVSH